MFDSASTNAGEGGNRFRPTLLGIAMLVSVAGAAWWQSGQGLADKKRDEGSLVPHAIRASLVRPLDLLEERGEAAIPEVIAVLTDEDPRLRREAILALSRVGEAVKPFVTVLRSHLRDADPLVRGQAATTLGRIDRTSPATAAALARLLLDGQTFVRNATSSALCEMGPTAIPVLLTMLSDPDPESRLQAVQVLQRLRGYPPEAAAALRRATNDPMAPVREAAIISLLLDQQAQLAEVIHWIHDKSPAISDTAIANLPRFGDAAVCAVPDLISRLETPRPGQLSWLLFALRSLNREASAAIPALMKLLDSPVDYDTGEILEAIVDIGADPALVVPLLVRFLDDDSPRIASRAGSLLSRLDPEIARRQALLLVERLDSRSGESTVVALAGLRGLGVNAVGATPRLVQMLRDGDGDRQEQVAQVLTRIGPAAAPAVPTLVALLKKKSQISRATVALIEAAGAIGPQAAPVVPFLMELIEIRDDEVRPAFRDPALDRARCVALMAAANIGVHDAAFLELARESLSSESLSMRIAAMQALAIVGEPAEDRLPDLLPAFEHGDLFVRLTAAQTIVSAGGGNPQVVASLVRLLQDGELEVRAAAAHSLGRLGPAAADAIPALRAAQATRDNYFPLNTVRPQRGRMLSPYVPQTTLPHFTVAQAAEQAVRRITAGSGVLAH